MPRARPLSPAGKAEVRMAIDGPKIMAPPTPWSSLKEIREYGEPAIAQKKEDSVYKTNPIEKTCFLPQMSAIFPIGTRTAAAASRKE
jgi:hypothetical protein